MWESRAKKIKLPGTTTKVASLDDMDLDSEHLQVALSMATQLTTCFPTGLPNQVHESLIVTEEYCCFCGDFIGEKFHACKE